ncbi:hypothetical protein DRH29_02240 [candidate division Kazan bacterium]|uniref:POTRA domain-containing protein n=1 Tax=candidate division Kazan bacterium TaxID=2202143 RepID=A0A420ZCY9_UNCK3|nr:MAG: hypothetical protein DRH29_02240 [candidate division Kazan bacterium]
MGILIDWLNRSKSKKVVRPPRRAVQPNRQRQRDVIKRAALQLTRVHLRTAKRPYLQTVYKVLVVLGLIFVGYLIFNTNFFVLDNLKIVGAHLSSQEEITNLLFPDGFTKVHALTFSQNWAKKKLTDIPQIKEVKFNKDLISDTLTITVVEYQSSIIWQTSGERFVVNRFGVVYDTAEPGNPLLVVEDLKNLPVSLNQRIVTPEFIEFVTSFAANLPRKTNISIERIMVPETTFEVEMKTSDGWTIILDTTKSYEDQLNNLVRVLREMEDNPPREYVDLRIGKKVFYK